MSYSTPAKRGGVETVSHTHFIFPVLKSTEILQCLDELGIDVCKAELTEPQRHREKIRKIFWQLLEHCTGITEEDIENSSVCAMVTCLDSGEVADKYETEVLEKYNKHF